VCCRFLYPLGLSLKDKIETICREMYGAVGVEYTAVAEQRLEVNQYDCHFVMLQLSHGSQLYSTLHQSYTKAGFDKLPICMAKTQYSLSTDAAAKGVPTGFTVLVRDVKAAVGAGYIYRK